MRKKKRWFLLLCCIGFLFSMGFAEASAGSVTGYQKITWGISTGRYYVNGIHAFCAQYSKSWPTVGTSVERIDACNNEVLRKALYYGYNGPKNTLGTDEKAHVLTAIAVSDANIGERETGASAKYDAFYWDLVNHPENYPSPPENFKAYMAITASDAMQNLAFYKVEQPKPQKGRLVAKKTSQNPTVSDGNSCYSLSGAKYSIYKNSSLAENTKVGTLTTNADGDSNTIELEVGTYYAKETTAPKGYAKSEKVTSFSIQADQTTTLKLTDVPQANPVDILIEKVDADTKEHEPQGAASLQGAQFLVQYYAGLWEENVNPESLGQQPKRTWIFETDEDGMIRYTEDYLVSGDALFSGIPLGTLVIREEKASEGYLLNDTVYIRQITAKGDDEVVSTYQHPVVEEKVMTYDLLLHKKDSEEKLLEGVTFTLYADEMCSQVIAEAVTDENGELRFENLYPKVIYYLKETTTLEGYLPVEDVFVICEDTVPENGEWFITVVNEKIIVPPEPEDPPKEEEPLKEEEPFEAEIPAPKTGDETQSALFCVFGWISFIIVAIMTCHNRFKCARMTR